LTDNDIVIMFDPSLTPSHVPDPVS